MNNIFVNLKRFEVSRKLGGLCDFDCPQEWIASVLQQCVQKGLGNMENVELTFFLPEALLSTAVSSLAKEAAADRKNLHLGCQSVYREDIKVGGNFGAFTSNRPATAAKVVGSNWAIIGHSEERKDKVGIITTFLEDNGGCDCGGKPADTVSRLIGQECAAALDAGLKVLVCVGESEAKGADTSQQEHEENVKRTLKEQLSFSLPRQEVSFNEGNLVIAYEPIWAIGPGKTPPGREHIAFVSAYIKEAVKELRGFIPRVVYGGGLKEENAGMLASIESIDGGLVALTRFTGEIGFYPDDLAKIIDAYREGRGQK